MFLESSPKRKSITDEEHLNIFLINFHLESGYRYLFEKELQYQ